MVTSKEHPGRSYSIVLPDNQRHLLRSTDMVECLNRKINHRTRVVSLFTNEESLLRLVHTIFVGTSEKRETGRTYLAGGYPHSRNVLPGSPKNLMERRYKTKEYKSHHLRLSGMQNTIFLTAAKQAKGIKKHEIFVHHFNGDVAGSSLLGQC